LELLHLDGQQRETLTDVIVKLSANPGTFLFLCLNQLSGNFRERLVDLLAAGDVLGKNEKTSG
jgi:hypothetical protein